VFVLVFLGAVSESANIQHAGTGPEPWSPGEAVLNHDLHMKQTARAHAHSATRRGRWCGCQVGTRGTGTQQAFATRRRRPAEVH
jgi:hypothetical protein